jgi:hypothetical protein
MVWSVFVVAAINKLIILVGGNLVIATVLVQLARWILHIFAVWTVLILRHLHDAGGLTCILMMHCVCGGESVFLFAALNRVPARVRCPSPECGAM